ncbi:MAG: acetaldehyde dehydrogenase (acetylating) [Saprospiraceae bacterium]
MKKVKVAIIGPGNIGTDLMIKILRTSEQLEMSVLVGIDPSSDGLARAERMGVATTSKGIDGLLEMDEWKEIKLIFDATSAKAHHYNWDKIKSFEDKRIIDLTPAAIGPYLVPVVNFQENLDHRNVNMVTCGGQATIPMVAAVNRVSPVLYGEIVASIASKSAGPGTRANIDEFTETTALAIEKVGGAKRGKAIIVLNPAEPPLVMRDTVFTLSEPADQEKIRESIHQMVAEIQKYVPGYALHQEVQFEVIPEHDPVFIEGLGKVSGLKTSILLQVRGAGHYLPEYAGNLDIMTSAALATGEKMAALELVA